jgi:diguanylate cyclase (GGDEF)-like protein
MWPGVWLVLASRRGTKELLSGHRRPWWLWFLSGGFAAAVALILLPQGAKPITCSLLEVGTVAALAAGLRLNRPPQRLTWILVLAAVAAVSATKLVWRIFGPHLPPFTGVADWLYLGVFLLLAVALGLLPLRARHRTRLADMTEVGIMACTIVVLAWSGVIDPFVDRLDLDPFVAVTASLLPLLGLLMVTTTARRVLTAGTRTVSGVLTVVAVTALLAGDTADMAMRPRTGQSYGGGPSVLAWEIATLLLATAVLHPSAATDEPKGAAADPADRMAAARPTRGMVARGYLLLILVSPTATAISLLRELESTEALRAIDVAVPLAATTVTAILLVFRLTAFARMAEQRTATLDARTGELETALAEQTALREELSHQASHDPLTGRPNRRKLIEEVDRALTDGEQGTLLLLDLDGFKDVNERYGHGVGDQLLMAIADRIHEIVPAPHTLARLGGDEFVVLLRGTSDEESAGYAEAILAALRRSFRVSPYQLHTAASIGLRRLDPEESAALVLSDADLALYAAKAAGRDQFVCYEPPLRTRHLAQARMVDRLRGALDREELTVYYQPVVDLADQSWVRVEALARWEPEGEVSISPDQFIPVAEDSGLIIALGTWVLRRACQDAVVWHRRHGTRLAVNVSVHQLREANFADVVRAALAESGLPASALSLELTESVLVGAGTQRTQAIAHLAALRAEGVQVAIDDFGTGYSSLSYLRTLPIDAVKIDRAFVPCERPDDARQVALVRAIVELARSLGLSTVVEGVETASQADVLHRLGCDLGQGYHYSRPVPAPVISARLAPVQVSQTGSPS